jgi:hypothetical protein
MRNRKESFVIRLELKTAFYLSYFRRRPVIVGITVLGVMQSSAKLVSGK